MCIEKYITTKDPTGLSRQITALWPNYPINPIGLCHKGRNGTLGRNPDGHWGIYRHPWELNLGLWPWNDVILTVKLPCLVGQCYICRPHDPFNPRLLSPFSVISLLIHSLRLTVIEMYWPHLNAPCRWSEPRWPCCRRCWGCDSRMIKSGWYTAWGILRFRRWAAQGQARGVVAS